MRFPKALRILLAVLWTAFIIYGLTTEPSGIPKFPWLKLPGVDKLIHAVLFGVEAGLLVFAFGSAKDKSWIPVLAWCFVLGGILELAQHYWIAGRSGDVLDLAANMVGGLLGIAAVRLFWK